MTSILLINNAGTIKSLKAKDITFETLYKKCGFKSAEEFDRRASWNTHIDGSDVITELWAKDDGKANTENKYDFPPPVDTALYFGTCAVVRVDKKTGAIINLTEDLWTKVYEKLFGGFEDIGDEDEYSEDELENVDPALLTSHGYLKDDFVVSDKEAIELDSEESDTAVTVSASKAAPKAKAKAKLKQEAEATSVVVKQPLKKSMKIKGQSKPQKKGEEDEGEGEASINKGEASINPKTKSKGKGKGKPKVKENVNEHDTDDKEETDTSELEEEVYTFSDDD